MSLRFAMAAGAALILAAPACSAPSAAVRVQVERLPQGGIQPQAIADNAGVVHVVYFMGDPASGDIHYVRRTPDGRYSEPVRVNSTPGSAIAVASVRGAQIALGRDNRVHVVWNGSDRARDHAIDGMPLWYARQRGATDGFEPERNLVTWAVGLDGGGTIAADARGRVVVAWQAGPAGRDARRAVYLSRSDDDGASFGRERRVSAADLGACACCSMRALIDRHGSLYLLYRAATNDVRRDTILLSSSDGGATFSSLLTDPWNVEACELTSASLAEGQGGVMAAWETRGQIRLATVTGAPLSVQSAPGSGRRKHPVIAHNAAGESLLAWLEGTAWARGGSVAWQGYDSQGRATSARGTAAGVPVWGLAAAAPLPDGRFLLLY